MKIFVKTFFVFGISACSACAQAVNSSQSQWAEKDCQEIEKGVGTYIAVSEHFRKAAEAAKEEGDQETSDEHWLATGFSLDLAANWATIHSSFCKN